MENGIYLDWAAGFLLAAEQILTGYYLGRLVRPFLVWGKGTSGNNLCGFRRVLGHFLQVEKSNRKGFQLLKNSGSSRQQEGMVTLMDISQKKSRLIWAAYTITVFLLWAMRIYPASSTGVGAGVLAAFLVLCLTDKRNYEQKAFLCVAFFCSCWLSYAITEILLDNLYSFATHTDYMRTRPQLWQALYLAMCLLHLPPEMMLMSVFAKSVIKAYTYKSANMSRKELCILLAPLFTGIGGFEIIHYYRNFYISKTGENKGAYDIRALIYYAVSLAAVIVVVGLYQSIRARQEERLQNELLAARIDSCRHHIEQVESLYQSIRAIKHDMANHLLTLETLYAGNKVNEAREYSAELKAALAGAAGGMGSGNPVTDVILQEWKSEAGKRGLSFRTDFYYPTDSGINAFDISVILNNALQNAVEYAAVGTQGESFVSVRAYHRNNAYLIEVSNSFSGNLRWDGESGLPVTSKSEGHGYGLPNIRRVAGKYAGDMVIDLKEGVFLLCVMLMMQE